MKLKFWFVHIAACALASLSASVHATSAEPMTDSDPLTLAKTAKARAKGNTLGHPVSGGSGTDGGCDVNIGNTINTQPNKGPKDVIVVVKGDVVNSNNKCK